MVRRGRSGLANIAVDRARAAKHILPAQIASMPLRSIRRKHVLAWLGGVSVKHVDVVGQRQGRPTKDGRRRPSKSPLPPSKRLSRGTVVHLLNLLRVALGDAVNHDMLETNPAGDVRVPRRERRTHAGWDVLAPAELAAVVVAAGEPWGSVVQFAAWTGLRLGELFALELPDVHLAGPEHPHVVVRYGGVRHRACKSGQPRTVWLVAPAEAALRAWLAARPAWLAKAKRETPLVFPSRRGCFVGRKPPKGWRAWLCAAGISRRIRWHDLRHTCASSLLSGHAGRRWSLEEVKELLGHSTIMLTERYAHFSRGALEQAARETLGATSTAAA